MDLHELTRANERIVDIALGRRFRPACATEWPADVLLAHVIANHRLNAVTTVELLAGRTPRYDNRQTQFASYLRAIVEAAATWPNLTDLVRTSAAELTHLAAELTDAQLETVLDVYVEDDEVVLVDRRLPWRAVLEAQMKVHLPGHTEQLLALAR
jgi:hypothetical protein